MAAPRKLIHGIGENDALESTAEGSRLRPYYNKWRDMIGRCYDGKHDAYSAVSVCSEWHQFTAFFEWMDSQPWRGNELDKDIIIPGNDLYHPDRCVFVPRLINLQFRRTYRSASGSKLPAGVYLYPYDGARTKYKVNGSGVHLGYTRDPMDGHRLWQAHKIESLQRLVGLSSDLRVNGRIESVINQIKSDLANGLETEWQ